MDKGSKKRPRDANQLAKLITDIATSEVDDTVSPKQATTRKAGKAGGPARAKALTAARRSEIAKKAARARWNKEL